MTDGTKRISQSKMSFFLGTPPQAKKINRFEHKEHKFTYFRMGIKEFREIIVLGRAGQRRA